ncbi:MAG: bifunctional O-acetylhomoserine aminocarboxypropyltransferase/cysteine synthase, partial [Rhodospirillales bacterium]|nr:bifunctional O-acetylhomoserine aminocarboxypropyltransferase/cysteine synthase [Rhodospirillales bacterium]
AETLTLRMARHSENALALAQWLESRTGVSSVSYAGLLGNPSYQLAQKYLPDGASGVLTFCLEGGYEAGKAVVEGCALFSHVANIGDTRSLIIHPASTTHRQLSNEDRTLAGAGDEVVRLSVGLEDLDDLIADLDQAIGA